MAPTTSFERTDWDATKLLDIINDHPAHGSFSCVGTTQLGYRCKRSIAQHNRRDAIALLRKLPRLAARDLVGINPHLRDLAKMTLCQRFHQDQVEQVTKSWCDTIVADMRRRQVPNPTASLTSLWLVSSTPSGTRRPAQARSQTPHPSQAISRSQLALQGSSPTSIEGTIQTQAETHAQSTTSTQTPTSRTSISGWMSGEPGRILFGYTELAQGPEEMTTSPSPARSSQHSPTEEVADRAPTARSRPQLIPKGQRRPQAVNESNATKPEEPTMLFPSWNRPPQVVEECAVCMEEMLAEDTLIGHTATKITSCTRCKQKLHIECLDAWVANRGRYQCPLCRFEG